MKETVKFILISLITLSTSLTADPISTPYTWSSLLNEKHHKTIVLTLQKSGTHLIHAAIGMITEKPVEQIAYQRIDFNHIDFQNEKTDIYHLWEEFSYLQEDLLSNANIVIMIRDPRDMAVSRPFHLERLGYDFSILTSPENFRLQLEQQRKHIQQALLWMQNPNVLVCRFEELVGPQGGGDLNSQMATIQRLATHMGVILSEERIAYIADHLFGPNSIIQKGTFRSGQIGSWRTAPWLLREIEMVKQLLGPAVIEMGYEEDYNW